MSYYIKVGKGGIKLEEYQGRYSLVSCWETRDGEAKVNWCEIEYGKGGEKKKRPVKVEIGDSALDAKRTLSELLEMLEGGQPQREAYAAQDNRPLPDDDQIPF